ncbi:YbaB/EbfC family nucleoid-associated protein [Nocardia anaemiae]|uniref:YbaB/EbfC family nucleoid-associated protein n=1 Tax=Nocardia anaemiae TaxID=263910 RepID=UPI0007A3BCA7|nr:YbaB/EbfC family nucleoid-associated protein [Nocardia anaemiae]
MDHWQYEMQRAQLADVRDELSAISATAGSQDGLVEVTVDQFGIITDVRLEPRALRGAAADLGRAVTEAAREAARLAHQKVSETIAPIEDIVGRMPEPEDLLPGAPSLREPDAEVVQESAPVPYEDDEYDDYYD